MPFPENSPAEFYQHVGVCNYQMNGAGPNEGRRFACVLNKLRKSPAFLPLVSCLKSPVVCLFVFFSFVWLVGWLVGWLFLVVALCVCVCVCVCVCA